MRPFIIIASLSVAMALTGLPLRAGDPPSPVSPRDRLLVLQSRFIHFKYGVRSRIEAVPGKSEIAERNIESALQRAVRRDDSGQFLALPDLSADEQATLSEYEDLLRQVAIAAITSRIVGPVPWRAERPWRFDYSIGDGLAFLAERTGVERAIFVSGARADPSAGIALLTTAALVLFDWPAVPGGNQKALIAIVVDLRSGDVLLTFMPERGFAGEADDVAGANTWMHALFNVIPRPILGELKLLEQPAPGKAVRTPRPRRGFFVMRPAGWITSDSAHLLCFQRHRAGLASICIDDETLDEALPEKGVKSDVDALQLGEIAVNLLKADDFFEDMQLTTLTRARVADRDGFRAELTSNRRFGNTRVRVRHVVYGVASPNGAHLIRFDAAAIYYFEHHLAEFEALIPTFKLTN